MEPFINPNLLILHSKTNLFFPTDTLGVAERPIGRDCHRIAFR